MTMFGDRLYQMGGVPVGGLMNYGKSFFVDPLYGSDGNQGNKISAPLRTLAGALGQCVTKRGDVVYLISHGNSAADCTDYQSVALNWNKDNTHLIGINGSGNLIQQRSRIAQLSTATGITGLLTVSANNCYFSNISIYQGVADATSKYAVKVTGQRNCFDNVTMSGIGNDLMDTTGNCSLYISAGAENIFKHCYIGLDTIARGTAVNSELLLDTGAVRNVFEDCYFLTYAEAATHLFIKVPVNGLDRFTMFKRCEFINYPTGDAAGTTMTQAFDVTGGGSPDGVILLSFCTLYGTTDWETTPSGKVIIRTDAGTAATAGLSADVA